MLLLIGFGFIAGVVTILSPCILPIMPIVLSSSASGGKKKPFGVVTGFISSFTFFTLFLASLVQTTGLSANFLRTFAVVVVFAFGSALVWPGFQVLVEKMFSKVAGKIPTAKGGDGFWSGVLVGLTLGLIWTPCVGPILASVISLSFTGEVGTTAVLITLAYSLGTAIPMLAIIKGGRELLNRVPWLLANTGKIQQGFGVLMVITAVGLYFNLDRKFQAYVLKVFPNYGSGLTSLEDNKLVTKELEKLRGNEVGGETKTLDEMQNSMFNKAPDIAEGEWLNSEPLTLESLRGKVVLIDFWTYSCINCIRTLPYLRDWHAKYADEGLVIIGVHTPEFEFEKSLDNLKQAVEDFELEYPIVQDNEYKTWRAYENRYWPAKYFIDKDGVVRHTHFGEGEYDESEQWIQKLLMETGKEIDEEIGNDDYQVETKTPELYLGYGRMEDPWIIDGVLRDTAKVYETRANLPLNKFGYSGMWMVQKERSISQESKAKLELNYDAKDVFLVMSSETKNSQVSVYLDGQLLKPSMSGDDVIDGIVTVDKERLYHLVTENEAQNHVLELEFENGVSVYAFTFG